MRRSSSGARFPPVVRAEAREAAAASNTASVTNADAQAETTPSESANDTARKIGGRRGSFDFLPQARFQRESTTSPEEQQERWADFLGRVGFNHGQSSSSAAPSSTTPTHGVDASGGDSAPVQIPGLRKIKSTSDFQALAARMSRGGSISDNDETDVAADTRRRRAPPPPSAAKAGGTSADDDDMRCMSGGLSGPPPPSPYVRQLRDFNLSLSNLWPGNDDVKGHSEDAGSPDSPMKRSMSSPQFLLDDINRKLKTIERPQWLQASIGADIGGSIRRAGERVLSFSPDAEKLSSSPPRTPENEQKKKLTVSSPTEPVAAVTTTTAPGVVAGDAVVCDPRQHHSQQSQQQQQQQQQRSLNAQTCAQRRAFWRSIRDEGRKFTIVTTASLPWMTGTAVNPLLRAAYLAMANKKVTLVVPWVPKEDQAKIFPGGRTFNTPDEQDAFVREWLHDRVGFSPSMRTRCETA